MSDPVPPPRDVAPLASGTSVADDRTMAILVHVLGLFTSFIGPLVLYLIKKDESPVVRHHAAEALNFQITVVIASIVSLVLLLVLVGIVTMSATMILGIVFPMMGAFAASRGELYRYPINIRFVN